MAFATGGWGIKEAQGQDRADETAQQHRKITQKTVRKIQIGKREVRGDDRKRGRRIVGVRGVSDKQMLMS